MTMPELAEWVELCRINSMWIAKYLIDHEKNQDEKVITRVFSLSFAGTQENVGGFVSYLIDQIPYFVFSNTEINAHKLSGKWTWREAVHYFGDVKSVSDGRYGELILFLLVESILKTPMIAHKIRATSSPQVQVKGSDGVFFGSYLGQESLLIGESKVMKDDNHGINEALSSINRFHKGVDAHSFIKQELIEARSNISNDLTPEQIMHLCNILDPDSEQYHYVNLVHPVLIVYDEDKINDIEYNCKNKLEGEKLIYELMQDESHTFIKRIKTKLKKLDELNKIYLDFFFIAMKDVTMFKELMYKEIH